MQNETDHKLWREGKGWHSKPKPQSGNPEKLAAPAQPETDNDWMKEWDEITGWDPYALKPLSGYHCRVKCCAWENSRLDREYRHEIGNRKKLLGSLRWGRLRALVIGWAIAKGQDPDEAKRFATHIQYH